MGVVDDHRGFLLEMGWHSEFVVTERERETLEIVIGPRVYKHPFPVDTFLLASFMSKTISDGLTRKVAS